MFELTVIGKQSDPTEMGMSNAEPFLMFPLSTLYTKHLRRLCLREPSK